MYEQLIDQFADKRLRNQAIIGVVGAINSNDLRKVKLSIDQKNALINGLSHSKAIVRWWCLQLMDHLADESFIPAMRSCLNDESPKVRKHAIHALTCDICKQDRCSLGADIELELRTLAELDNNESVRQAAKEALKSIRIG